MGFQGFRVLGDLGLRVLGLASGRRTPRFGSLGVALISRKASVEPAKALRSLHTDLAFERRSGSHGKVMARSWRGHCKVMVRLGQSKAPGQGKCFDAISRVSFTEDRGARGKTGKGGKGKGRKAASMERTRRRTSST